VNTKFSTPTTDHQVSFGFALWRLKDIPSMGVAHTHPDIELNWVPRARLEYAIAGKRAAIAPGELGVFWGGVPHQLLDSSTGDSGGIWLTLPLSWFLSRTFSNDLSARLLAGELVTAKIEGFRPLQWEKDFRTPETQRLILLELEAMLERIALYSPQQQKKLVARMLPEHSSFMERITAHLAAHFREPLSVQDIAEVMNLHPKYLMNAFKQSCGITIKTYLLHLRLAHAQRLLSTTSLSILDVAMESGFGSLGRFYDSFARHVGERPLVYRRRRSIVPGSV
jgi:AraC family transcriptional regulator, melibiose operon regulatory protein